MCAGGADRRGVDDGRQRPASVKASLSVAFGQRAPNRAGAREEGRGLGVGVEGGAGQARRRSPSTERHRDSRKRSRCALPLPAYCSCRESRLVPGLASGACWAQGQAAPCSLQPKPSTPAGSGPTTCTLPALHGAVAGAVLLPLLPALLLTASPLPRRSPYHGSERERERGGREERDRHADRTYDKYERRRDYDDRCGGMYVCVWWWWWWW